MVAGKVKVRALPSWLFYGVFLILMRVTSQITTHSMITITPARAPPLSELLEVKEAITPSMVIMIPDMLPIITIILPMIAFAFRPLLTGRGLFRISAIKIIIKPRNIKSAPNHRLVINPSFSKVPNIPNKMLSTPIITPIIERIFPMTANTLLTGDGRASAGVLFGDRKICCPCLYCAEGGGGGAYCVGGSGVTGICETGGGAGGA